MKSEEKKYSGEWRLERQVIPVDRNIRLRQDYTAHHTLKMSTTHLIWLYCTEFCSCTASSILSSSLYCLHAHCGWILMQVRCSVSPAFGSSVHAHQSRQCQCELKDKVPAWVISHVPSLPNPMVLVPMSARAGPGIQSHQKPLCL